MAWLVTGGAGYIGAHVVAALRAEGEGVVVLDDLSTGLAERLPDDVIMIEASVGDTDTVARALSDHGVHGVVHLAAKKAVGESIEQPLLYYRENACGLVSLLNAVTSSDAVTAFVFSSSASVYGTPDVEQVSEDAPTVPESPYGETKLAGEWLVRAAARAQSGLRWAVLRYFNVVGAAEPRLGDVGVHNLVPLVFAAMAAGRRPQIFGGDYPTRDGSCIRDYIHVADIADAHVAAVRAVSRGEGVGVLNIGRGEGVTVKEVLAQVAATVGHEVPYDVIDRRAGDPAQVVATVERAAQVLGWRAGRDITDMVGSAWVAWEASHAARTSLQLRPNDWARDATADRRRS